MGEMGHDQGFAKKKKKNARDTVEEIRAQRRAVSDPTGLDRHSLLLLGLNTKASLCRHPGNLR